MTKEFFNRSLGKLDQALIDEYYLMKAELKRQKRGMRLRTAVIIAAALLIVAMAFPIIAHIRDIINNEDIGLYDPGSWVITDKTSNTLQRTMTTDAGVIYLMNISYSDQSITSLKNAKMTHSEDIGAQLYGQWLISLATCNYSMHFELFQKELLDLTVYKDFEKLGYGTDEAYKKIDKTARDTLGVKFETCRIDYTVTDIKINDEETVNYYREHWNSLMIHDYVSSIDDIEAFATYYVENNVINFGDLFCIDDIDWEDPDMICYKYKGRWYVDYSYLDDDLSIDLLESYEGDGHYYKEKADSGTVQSIESGYINLGDKYYYLMPEGENDIAVGDEVIIKYRSVDLECKRVSDGSKCRLAVATSVTKGDAEAITDIYVEPRDAEGYYLPQEYVNKMDYILNTGDWSTDTAECASDYIIHVGDSVYYYHSDCGNVSWRGASHKLASSDKKWLDEILEKCLISDGQ
ncbi:MAG: hypothetical protein IJD70_04420 [Clostridia bacterium]|nr:hypothetical protein [Clostridia bacterium]